MRNKSGDNIQPCLTPERTLKGSPSFPLCNTLHEAPRYNSCISRRIVAGSPQLSSIFHIMLRSKLSNACLKSTNSIYSGVHHSFDCSAMILRVLMWSTQDRSGLNPACCRRIWGSSFVAILVYKSIAFSLFIEFKTDIQRQFEHLVRY